MLSKIIMLIVSSMLFAIPMTSKLYGITTLLAPTLLLIYFYRATTKREILLAFLGIMIATILSTYRVMPGGVISAIISAVIMSTVILLLLILNKWIVNHTGAVIAVLFYPILMTGYEYFTSYGSQFSTFSSSVNSLIGLKPIIQWTSVGGIWLVMFLISLVIALIAFGLRDQIQVKYIITACLIGVVLIIGGAFIMKEGNSESIQATGLTPNPYLWDVAAGSLFGQPDEQPTYDEAAWNTITKDLLQKTEEAARTGSQLVVWAEGATALSEENEKDLLAAAEAMAKDNNSLLILSYIIIHDQTGDIREKWMDNKAVIIDNRGDLLATYNKVALVFNETKYFNPGTEALPVVDTDYGRIALAICYDADLPSRVLLAGQKKPQLLVIPASDWEAITPYHTKLSAIRGIENGMSVFRVTKLGLSAVYNEKGTEISSMNDFDYPGGSVFHTSVPIVKTNGTLYQVCVKVV